MEIAKLFRSSRYSLYLFKDRRTCLLRDVFSFCAYHPEI